MKKLCVLVLFFVNVLFANIGSVTMIEGDVFVKRDSKTHSLHLGSKIQKNDYIETKANSKVKITFIDNTIITIGKDSSLDIKDYNFLEDDPSSAKTELSVTKGAFHAITGKIGKVNPNKFKIKTKNATIGIRGTEIYGNQSKVICTQGMIFVESLFGDIKNIAKGNFVHTIKGKPLSDVIKTDTTDLQSVTESFNIAKKNATLVNTIKSDTKTSTANQQENNIQNSQSTASNQNDINKMLTSVDGLDNWGYWDSNTKKQEVAQIEKLNKEQEKLRKEQEEEQERLKKEQEERLKKEKEQEEELKKRQKEEEERLKKEQAIKEQELIKKQEKQKQEEAARLERERQEKEKQKLEAEKAARLEAEKAARLERERQEAIAKQEADKAAKLEAERQAAEEEARRKEQEAEIKRIEAEKQAARIREEQEKAEAKRRAEEEELRRKQAAELEALRIKKEQELAQLKKEQELAAKRDIVKIMHSFKRHDYYSLLNTMRRSPKTIELNFSGQFTRVYVQTAGTFLNNPTENNINFKFLLGSKTGNTFTGNYTYVAEANNKIYRYGGNFGGESRDRDDAASLFSFNPHKTERAGNNLPVITGDGIFRGTETRNRQGEITHVQGRISGGKGISTFIYDQNGENRAMADFKADLKSGKYKE